MVPKYALKKGDSQRKHLTLSCRNVFRALQLFGRHIQQCAFADGRNLKFVGMLRNPEISEFVHSIFDENILRFDIFMENFSLDQVNKSQGDLVE